MTIDEAVKKLNAGDLVRVKWKPIIRLYGRDTFVGEYMHHDKDNRTMTVRRDWFDACDIKIEAIRTMPYDRIESLEKLEPQKLYCKSKISESK